MGAVKHIEHIKAFFPDFEGDELPERAYFWNILATVSPASTKTLVQKARRNIGADEENDPENLIEICPQLLNEIKELSSHKGITDSIFLLL